MQLQTFVRPLRFFKNVQTFWTFRMGFRKRNELHCINRTIQNIHIQISKNRWFQTKSLFSQKKRKKKREQTIEIRSL